MSTTSRPLATASPTPPTSSPSRSPSMPGLEDLYREIILDHYRNPRNRGELDAPPAQRVEGFNPLCGDEIVVYLNVGDDGRIDEIKIGGEGQDGRGGPRHHAGVQGPHDDPRDAPRRRRRHRGRRLRNRHARARSR